MHTKPQSIIPIGPWGFSLNIHDVPAHWTDDVTKAFVNLFCFQGYEQTQSDAFPATCTKLQFVRLIFVPVIKSLTLSLTGDLHSVPVFWWTHKIIIVEMMDFTSVKIRQTTVNVSNHLTSDKMFAVHCSSHQNIQILLNVVMTSQTLTPCLPQTNRRKLGFVCGI